MKTLDNFGEDLRINSICWNIWKKLKYVANHVVILRDFEHGLTKYEQIWETYEKSW